MIESKKAYMPLFNAWNFPLVIESYGSLSLNLPSHLWHRKGENMQLWSQQAVQSSRRSQWGWWSGHQEPSQRSQQGWHGHQKCWHQQQQQQREQNHGKQQLLPSQQDQELHLMSTCLQMKTKKVRKVLKLRKHNNLSVFTVVNFFMASIQNK